ncbi:MAG: OmpA family protein [Candidatus Cryptobacteroides sp.]
MKRLDYLLGITVIAVLSLSVSPAVIAQENGNRDENGKIVRGPYLTNRFCDNWFIEVGGGLNFFWTDGYKIAIGPSLDANFGKWFTPAVGMRIGYQGLSTRIRAPHPSVLGAEADEDMFAQKFGYMYIHGDFLWNLSDACSGYKQTRFWNFIPYLHAGYFRSYGLEGADFHCNDFAGGVGLLHNLRLVERLDLIIDMRATMTSSRVCGGDGGFAILPSVTLGLAVDLGCPSFVRYSTALEMERMDDADRIAALEASALALEVANASLMDENRALVKANRRMDRELKNSRTHARPEPALLLEDMEPVAVYFEIGKTELSRKEMKHLEYVAENIVSSVEGCRPVYLTVMGTADGNTGSKGRNAYLSEARAKYVFDILTEKFGISPERLCIKAEVLEKAAQPEFSRAVFISF